MVKNLPAMQETQVRTLGQEDSPGEMNGYLLQCACLENPMDRGTWQVIVHGVKIKYTLSQSTFSSRLLILKNIKYMLKKYIYKNIYCRIKGFPDGSAVENLPAMQKRQETLVQFLGPEDPLEKEKTTHSSFFTQIIPWTGEPGGR